MVYVVIDEGNRCFQYTVNNLTEVKREYKLSSLQRSEENQM